MQISAKTWNNYITRLSKLNQTAGQLMQKYIEQHGVQNTSELIGYAYGLVTKYGEGSAELACQMYEALAAAEGVTIPAAEPAATASYGEVARMIHATKQSPPQMQQGVSRLVKRASSDTTLQNAQRDGAQFAWVPHGDTCPFCITLASRGWQRISKTALKKGHAEHIHANCDCEYAVRFDSNTGVAGYDPDEYLRQYNDAGGDLNAMRRERYAQNKEHINAQKRAAYKARKVSTAVAESDIIKTKPLRTFSSEQVFQKHYEKHSQEFDGISAQEYLKAANALADAEISEDVVQLTRSDNSVSKYRFSTNEFIVVTEDGNIRTYFKPKTKEAYWDEELKRNE